MPHEVCQQGGCWLSRFCTKSLAGVPAPKFYLGQTVAAAWFSEERNAWVKDEGLIVGMQFQPPEALTEEWWYTVRLMNLGEYQPWLEPGYTDLIEESELTAIEEPATKQTMSSQQPAADDRQTWVTTTEAAARLEISEAHLLRMRKDALFKLGVHYRDIGRSDSARPTYRWNVEQIDKVLSTPFERRKRYPVSHQKRSTRQTAAPDQTAPLE